jgi:hypothetical protein
MVYVDYQAGGDSVIEDADVDQRSVLGAYAVTHDGLVATVGPGEALIGSGLTREQGTQTVSLTGSATNRIWLLSTGLAALTVDDDEPPEPYARLIWVGTTDGSGVTAEEDRRSFTGLRMEVLRFRFDDLTGTPTSYAMWPHASTGVLRYPTPVLLVMDAAWDSASAGSIEGDVEQRVGAGAYSTLFTSGNHLPTIAYDATDPRAFNARPDVVEIEPWSQLRATLPTLPGDGTPPSGADLYLFVEVSTE